MAQLNPFELFGIPVKYAIDVERLETTYIEIQRKVHPDRFANATDVEKRVAQQWASFINEAYATLKDPVQRGKLLCDLMNVKVDELSSGAIDEEFLLEQLDRRERLEDAINAKDEFQLKKIGVEINTAFEALSSELENKIDNEKNAVEAAEIVQKLLFLNRQRQELMRG